MHLPETNLDPEGTVSSSARPASRRKGPKVNTCAPSSKKKRLERQLAGILAHLERHPTDTLSQMRVAAIRSQL